MIPKIIHMCWLSGDEYPESIKQCIDSWKRIMPDYKIRVWDTKRFDVNSRIWTKQAFETKKYAFAADFIRLYALYTEGGIYLDSDVMVFKSFDDLLDLPYFVGEDNVHCFEAAVIGAEKGCPWIKEVLDRYDENLLFIQPDGSYNMRGLPVVFHDRLTSKYSFKLINSIAEFKSSADTICIFPREWFNSRDFVDWKQYPQSYCSHKFAGTWLSKKPSRLDSLKKALPRFLVNIGYKLRYELMDKKSICKVQIPYK